MLGILNLYSQQWPHFKPAELSLGAFFDTVALVLLLFEIAGQNPVTYFDTADLVVTADGKTPAIPCLVLYCMYIDARAVACSTLIS